MSGCDEFNLSLYIDGMLSAEETRRLNAHLHECENCRAELDELNDMKIRLQAFGELELPPDFHKEALAKLRGQKERRLDFVTKRIPSPRVDFGRIGTVAAGLLLTLILFSGVGALMTPQKSGVSMSPADGGLALNTGASSKAEVAEAQGYAPAAEVAEAQGYAPAAAAPMAPQMAMTEMAGAPEFDSEDMSLYDTKERASFSAAADSAAADSAEDSGETVKNYNIYVEVDDFDAAMAVIDGLPGYNTSSNIYSNDTRTSSDANIRRMVSASEYDHTKAVLRGLGKIHRESESAQRVFMDVADTEARIRAKEIELERLFELLRRSDTVNAMVLIERRLEATSGELDNLKSTDNQYKRQLASSTFDIELVYRDYTPQYKTAQTFGERLNASFIGSLNGTFAFIEGAAVFISSIGLQLILLIVAAFAVYLVRSTLRRRRGHENQ